jgi:hypothetical protein
LGETLRNEGSDDEQATLILQNKSQESNHFGFETQANNANSNNDLVAASSQNETTLLQGAFKTC